MRERGETADQRQGEGKADFVGGDVIQKYVLKVICGYVYVFDSP